MVAAFEQKKSGSFWGSEGTDLEDQFRLTFENLDQK
jgi:hypothetical protein